MSRKALPPEVQQLIVQYQTLKETHAKIDAELKLTEAELTDVDTVLNTVKGLEDGAELYKVVGHILVKKTKSDVIKELEERKEILSLKRDKYKKQIDFLVKQISELETKLKEALGKYGIPVGQA
ncbi:MAG: prefoldin subunit beta [Thermosphaera sp.]